MALNLWVNVKFFLSNEHTFLQIVRDLSFQEWGNPYLEFVQALGIQDDTKSLDLTPSTCRDLHPIQRNISENNYSEDKN